MREIKFRAWDKERREYLSDGQVLIGIQPHRNPANSIFYLDILKCPNMYIKRFDIQQYTGMNDCNNVEIYDGDICVDSKDNVIRIMQTNSYQWGCKVIKSNNFSIRGLTFPLWQWDDDRKFKIIGNIHENTELLEVE